MSNSRAQRAMPALALAGMGLLVVVPVLYVLLQALFPDIALASLANPFAHWRVLAREGELGGLLANTLGLGLAVVAGSLLLGLPLGLVRGLCDLPGARYWDLAFLIPFMIPPYIAAMGWILLLQPAGYWQQALGWNGAGLLFSVPGVVVVMVLNLFPVVYFAVSRAAASAGGRLAMVARISGASPVQALLRITLPLMLPSLAASALLVFAMTIEEYGTPAVLASNVGFFVLVTGIERRLSDWPIDLPGAALLSCLLMLLALAAYALQRALLRGRGYATTDGKPQQLVRAGLGLWRWPVLALFALAALAATLLPLLSIVLTAFTGTLSGGVAADNFTLRHFAAIFVQGSDAWSALSTSFSLAAGVALLTGALGSLVAYCVLRFRSRWVLALDAVSVLPNAMPGIVVAVGLILAWNQPWLPITPYNTWVMLLMAYACLLLPYPIRYANAALQQISENLESAARVHGAGPWTMLGRIVLPLLAPAVGAAMLLVFSIASRELVASLLLAPTGMQTVSVYVWRQFEQGSVGEGMAMSLVAIAVAALLVLAAQLLKQREPA
ncbi:ABC transporter permease [Comamonas composti]|uniref:ABC transporter permease n=1 Tax=Comamonas composti TaxID=408558 RepID=UPI00047A8B13|nr:iron ABC transporter permease [Comamonas composti]